MSAYLSEDESLAELVQRIPEQDKAAFAAMKASRIEAAFTGRHLVLYKPTGLTKEGTHRPPEFLTTVGFSDFFCDGQEGADVVVHDIRADERMTIGHTPTRLFDYDVFLSIPVVYRLRWDARYVDTGLVRSLVFPVSIWTKNRSSYFSAGVTYVETPNRFRDMYPGVKIAQYGQ